MENSIKGIMKHKKLSVPIVEIRKFWDGSYSVIARVWGPQKKFYEHPGLITSGS